MPKVTRLKENPLLEPDASHHWEAEAAFNGCPLFDRKSVHLVYRAQSAPQQVEGKNLKISSIGYAKSADGIAFGKRRQFIKPEEEWELYGCEDPRVTKLDGRYFVFYTALSLYPFRAEGIKVGVAITKDFKTIEEKHPVTFFNSKAMTLFPERINGKIAALLSVHTDSPPAQNCIAFFDTEEDIWSKRYWNKWYASMHSHILPLERAASDMTEIGAPPIKTEHGWLLVYADIKNYHSEETPSVYSIDAVLLDLENPKKIVGRLDKHLLVPEKPYELKGKVPNVIFPSGAFVKDDTLYIYYSGADTRICAATVSLSSLLKEMRKVGKRLVHAERYTGNPIVEPVASHEWEAQAVFNPAALYLDKKFHILYRATSHDNTSVIGYAASKNGLKVTERLDKPAYVPREPFELKPNHGGFSGCEDPRAVQIGETIYMTYTAYNGKTPRVAFTSIAAKDFSARRWEKWKAPILITPPGTENKNSVLFPRQVGGKYVFLHRPDNRDVWIDFVSDLEFRKDRWLGGHVLFEPREGSWDSLKIGAAAPPFETEHGWLLLYHGLSETSRHYRVGAVLLDLENPRTVLARTRDPILQPMMPYEREGYVPNVVFPCGAVLRDDMIFIYYGGADSVVCAATVPYSQLMEALLAQKDV